MQFEWRSKTEPLFTWVQDGSELVTLEWSRRERPVSLEWMGPDKLVTSAVNDSYSEKSIAAVFGPPGEKGEQGQPGPAGIQGPPGQDGYIERIPDILDGGNF